MTVNSDHLCRHLVSIPPGPHLISDILISSPILSEDRGSSIPAELLVGGDAPAASGSSGANNFEFGVDPSLDPELAMVRYVSLHYIAILKSIP